MWEVMVWAEILKADLKVVLYVPSDMPHADSEQSGSEFAQILRDALGKQNFMFIPEVTVTTQPMRPVGKKPKRKHGQME